ISNHSEMDHSGALIKTAEIIKPEKVFCSKNGAEALKKHLNPNFELTVVKTGDKIDLGGKTVSFIETRMLHWPDSMFTYLHEDRILFSQDAFGMHLASSERFYDKIDNYILETEAEKYYANILLPYSDLILKLLSQISSLNIDIKMIATDHGPIWRNNGICKILSLYEKWALQKPQNRAIIIFDTMWGSTTKMAEAISDGIIATGTEVKLMPLSANHRSDIATEQLNSGAILFGSPTLNNNIFPTMADLIFYLKGLRPKNKIGAAFGSYGWSGEATRQLDSFLKEMKFEIVSEPISVKYVPTRDELNKCFELGKKIAEKLKSLTQN
ncbi:MAG TPA: flavodoxin domain-containing protein, partial [Victivallales bacterium]|nr:flavodoxin domain-containing protein [Victivallales bacterium]